jgi:hypothetical protein
MRAEEAAVRVARIVVVPRLRSLSIGDRPEFDIHPQGLRTRADESPTAEGFLDVVLEINAALK